MPVINRKRHAQEEPAETPPPARRRPSPPASEASSIDGDQVDEAGEEYGATQTQTSQEQMVKKLVRLALASEYSRRVLKREDIVKKVMAPHIGRQFRHIFDAANNHLIHTFGMTLTELPAREKVTVAQKRAAQRSAGNKTFSHSTQANGESTPSTQPIHAAAAAISSSSSSSSSKQYILTSTLPARYRTAEILPPARIPNASAEGGYVGLTTFVLSLIYLSPGHTLPESRLEKHLRTMNAGDYVLGEKTEKGALARMQREGYIVKVRERGEGEDTVDYHIGPRGKAEVGELGVAGLVREVYGSRGGDEVERRLVRSLGDVVIEKKAARAIDGEEGGDGEEEVETAEREVNAAHPESERRQTRRSSGRRRGRRDDEDDEGDEEEAEDEDSVEGEDDEGVDEEEGDDDEGEEEEDG